jgi:hypothetical protein
LKVQAAIGRMVIRRNRSIYQFWSTYASHFSVVSQTLGRPSESTAVRFARSKHGPNNACILVGDCHRGAASTANTGHSSRLAESGRLVRRMSHRVDPAAIAEEARTVRLDAVFEKNLRRYSKKSRAIVICGFRLEYRA